eukprot:TRINITY_DN27918_c0_g1_i1.p1 TRINITY_DN27918_c0_g1~~TRINITY_DN27918_c0_g1_i1.p1  ORF type:complete len:318 (-),score=58.15 TRINITY_DN27918_c0_g1_i1:97-1050(-)
MPLCGSWRLEHSGPTVLLRALVVIVGSSAYQPEHDAWPSARPVSRVLLGGRQQGLHEPAVGIGEVSRLLRREAALPPGGHGAQGNSLHSLRTGPVSALQVYESPFTMDALHWYHSTNVTFHNTHTDIPKGGWIMSMTELQRPTIVEAEFRSAGKSGPVGMSLFSEEHKLKESIYAVTTGAGKWHDSAMSMPGDERTTVGFNNDEDKWALVKFDLKADGMSIFINDNLVHNSTNTDLSTGYVQFIAEKEPMQVRGVRWRRDCEFTSWEAGVCSVSCGHGSMKSTRVQLAPALFGGSCKGGVERTDVCYKGPCDGFDMR